MRGRVNAIRTFKGLVANLRFTTNFSASFFSDFHNFSNFSNFIQWSFLWISWNPHTFLWKIYIFVNKNKEFFEAMQKKEGERNSLVSKSFTFYYSYLCFPFVISRLHSLLLLLCGDLRFSHGKGHRYRPPREERDTTQHTAHARTGRIYRQTDGVRQDGQCHTLGTCTTEWEWGKGEDAYRNRLRPQKIQEICIFQITNKIRMNKG